MILETMIDEPDDKQFSLLITNNFIESING